MGHEHVVEHQDVVLLPGKTYSLLVVDIGEMLNY